MEMEDFCYTFNEKKKGLAYIIVNKKFKAGSKYANRTGAEKDYENMKKVFKLLGFKLFPFKDQTAKEMEDILTKASERTDLNERPSFVCVISSHGGQRSVGVSGEKPANLEHFVVGSDGKHVETRTLIDKFSSSNCSGLKNKPKLFFIQACNVNENEKDERKKYDDGVDLKYIKYLNELMKQRDRHDAVDATSSSQEGVASSTQVSSTPASVVVKDMEEDHLWLDNYLEEFITDTTDGESDKDDECRDESKPTTDTSVACTMEETTVLPTGSHDREPMHKMEISESESKSMDETNSGKKDDRIDTNISSATFKEVVVDCPCHEDMIVMFASPSGKSAWRDETRGSWMLLCLHLVVLEHKYKNDIGKTDFLSFLTEVSSRMSSMISVTDQTMSTGKKIVPVINHKLLKDIYFPVKKKTV